MGLHVACNHLVFDSQYHWFSMWSCPADPLAVHHQLGGAGVPAARLCCSHSGKHLLRLTSSLQSVSCHTALPDSVTSTLLPPTHFHPYTFELKTTSRFARFATASSIVCMSSPAPDNSLCRGLASTPRLHLFQLPDCIRFNCCFLIASASPQSRLTQLLLPDSIRFSYCSPVASTCSPSHSGRFRNILEHSSLSSRFMKYTSVTHRQTHIKILTKPKT